MIKAIIFDLDSCLAAANEIGDALFEPAFDAIRSANIGHVPENQIQAAFADMWRFPFDFIANKYKFSAKMRAAGFATLSRIEVRERMYGYGDIAVLADLQAKLFLVTSGFRRLQQSKIDALNIANLFTEIHIDAIDEPNPKGKQPVFESILKTHGFSPSEVLIVGDNPDSEIAAGNRLEITTIQTLRPGVPPSTAATYQIRNLGELKRIIGDNSVSLKA